MALDSARFSSIPRLHAAAEGRSPLAGGLRSRAVHVVQFALLDLGYSMPRSTGGSVSPDGIYGDETVAIVKAFQRSRPGLTEDGIVGRNTMRALDREFLHPWHRVRMHFISISMTNIEFSVFYRGTRLVYDQYGISMEFTSGRSLWLDEQQTRTFDSIDQDCEWRLDSGEYNRLHSLGPSVPSNELKVYFVNRARGVLGCGGHAAGRPAATVAREAWPWDVAHEVGHVLLTSNYAPVHHPQRRNLMHSHPSGRQVRILTRSQVQQMRRHACCMSQC